MLSVCMFFIIMVFIISSKFDIRVEREQHEQRQQQQQKKSNKIRPNIYKTKR